MNAPDPRSNCVLLPRQGWPRLSFFLVMALFAAHCLPSAVIDTARPPDGLTDGGTITIAISPRTPVVETNATINFSAVVTGSSDTAVLWSVQEGPQGGNVNATGVYTAPSTAGTYHVVAQSHADPSKSDAATITVIFHTVGDCSNLPAAGNWESINPPGIPFPPPSCGSQPCFFGSKAPLIDPLNSGIIYLGVDQHGVFKSTDCGAHWVKINTGRNGATLDTGAQWSMAIDPVDSRILYANNGYGSLGLYKSINGGVDWDELFPGQSFAQIISMDPTDRTHLVVSFHNGCTDAYAPNCLAETNDSGQTWRLIRLPIGGAEASGVTVVDTNTWLYVGDSLQLTTDRGVTWTRVADQGGYNLYRAVDGTYYLGGGSGSLLRSRDLRNWTALPVGAYSVIGDGITLFSSPRFCSGNCYSTSPERDGASWTVMSRQPASDGHGAVNLLYDPDHHLLYSSNEQGGFWRMVTH